MILTRNEYTYLDEFITNNSTTALAINAGKAWKYYRDGDNIDDYVVIEVGAYYAIAKIINHCKPIEICDAVQPFDEERAYPLQKVQKRIDWVY